MVEVFDGAVMEKPFFLTSNVQNVCVCVCV